MPLTPAQLQVLKAHIAGDAELDAHPDTSDGAFAIAAVLNGPAVPAFRVWQTAVPVADVFDNVVWANFTPADAPDNTVAYSNRSLACQGKQFNLQTLLVGRETINAAKTSIRLGIQDATQQLPSGAGGATRTGGWPAIQPILSRDATRAEKLFATGGAGTTASPSTMTFEGQLDYQDVQAARNLG